MVHVLAVVAVVARPLLIAVGRVVGGVEVEDDAQRMPMGAARAGRPSNAIAIR